MTVHDIQTRIDHIEACKGDYERAHSMEDDLWRDVLTAIANGADDASARLAFAALQSRNIDFARYCA